MITKFEKFLSFLNIETDQKIIEDLYAQSEMTKTYTFLLLLANFIALFGLITNSVAVIIGAMLISPLMGPIISFGFAYIASERVLMKQSAVTIVKSLVYVIASAAVLSYLSPLNDITNQILIRTKPNLYDLFIAIFSGLTVAVSFMSKKANGVTILTGVAIATSIIPPLSVVGFGIGTGNWSISIGSFLLFFTNFTAIVATTALSGILFGYNFFHQLKDFNYIKKRLLTVVVIIFVISVPLSYTLKKSIEEVRVRRVINQAVNSIKDASIFNISYSSDKDKILHVQIALASARPVTKDIVGKLENTIDTKLNIKSSVSVTQVALKEDILKSKTEIVKPVKKVVQPETVKSITSRFYANINKVIRQSSNLLAPYELDRYSVSVASADRLSIILFIKKDTDCTEEENRMLSNLLRTQYGLNADVRVITVPIFKPIAYDHGSLKPINQLPDFGIVKKLLSVNKNMNVEITSISERNIKKKDRLALAKSRVTDIKDAMKSSTGISEDKFIINYETESAQEPQVLIKVK